LGPPVREQDLQAEEHRPAVIAESATLKEGQ